MRRPAYRLTISALRSETSFCLHAEDDMCAMRQTDCILSKFEGADADVNLMLGSAVIYAPRKRYCRTAAPDTGVMLRAPAIRRAMARLIGRPR